VSMEKNLPDSDFNTLKWALVDGVKNGFDPKEYASYLFGHLLEGKSGPGRISADAKSVFLKARRTKTKPLIPDYQGVFTKALPPAPVYTPPTAKVVVEEAVEDAEESVDAILKKSLVKKAAPRRVETPAPTAAPDSPALQELWPGLEQAARSYLGTPYVWGGVTHRGIDCSALTQNSYGENRVKIPRVSRDQWKTGAKTESLREGDLIFFNTMGAGVSHVAMVVDAKNKKFIHASSSKGVMIADLGNKWFGQRYLGARRVVP
ncbi:MAG: C40 family peptidase, partial [Elusimicrobia bacterium]|nr:C40 family peptidase [Elusimicrobiota bacterium]